MLSIKQFAQIYEANKELDDLFAKKYDLNDNDIFLMNVLELLVEIGELANETKCFKYWSIKAPNSRSIVLDEYADCMLMTLAFCNWLQVSLDEEFLEPTRRKVYEQFIYLYKISSSLKDNYNKETIREILANLIYLGSLLNFSDQDIIDGCLHKINKNKQRLQNCFAE